MGVIELQVFVGLVVILGAAFVALICDFLKGNNEQLREQNLVMRVREDERDRRDVIVERVQEKVQRQTLEVVAKVTRTAPPATEVVRPAAAAEPAAEAPVRDARELFDRAERERSGRRRRAERPAPPPMPAPPPAPVNEGVSSWAQDIVLRRQAAHRETTPEPVAAAEVQPIAPVVAPAPLTAEAQPVVVPEPPVAVAAEPAAAPAPVLLEPIQTVAPEPLVAVEPVPLVAAEPEPVDVPAEPPCAILQSEVSVPEAQPAASVPLESEAAPVAAAQVLEVPESGARPEAPQPALGQQAPLAISPLAAAFAESPALFDPEDLRIEMFQPVVPVVALKPEQLPVAVTPAVPADYIEEPLAVSADVAAPAEEILPGPAVSEPEPKFEVAAGPARRARSRQLALAAISRLTVSPVAGAFKVATPAFTSCFADLAPALPRLSATLPAEALNATALEALTAPRPVQPAAAQPLILAAGIEIAAPAMPEHSRPPAYLLQPAPMQPVATAPMVPPTSALQELPAEPMVPVSLLKPTVEIHLSHPAAEAPAATEPDEASLVSLPLLAAAWTPAMKLPSIEPLAVDSALAMPGPVVALTAPRLVSPSALQPLPLRTWAPAAEFAANRPRALDTWPEVALPQAVASPMPAEPSEAPQVELPTRLAQMQTKLALPNAVALAEPAAPALPLAPLAWAEPRPAAAPVLAFALQAAKPPALALLQPEALAFRAELPLVLPALPLDGLEVVEEAPLPEAVAAEPETIEPEMMEPETMEPEALEPEPEPEEPVVRIRVVGEQPAQFVAEPLEEPDLPALVETEQPEPLRAAAAASAETFLAGESLVAGVMDDFISPVTALHQLNTYAPAGYEFAAQPLPPAFAPELIPSAAIRSNVVQMPVGRPAEPPKPAELEVPGGFQDSSVLARLMEDDRSFHGLAFTISVVDYVRMIADQGKPAAEQLMGSITRMVMALTREQDFACRLAEDEFVLLFVRETGAAAKRRIQLVSERLWDFQLRSLGTVSVIFSWGASESQAQPLVQAIENAREQMLETRRNRRSFGTPVSRFRRLASR